MKQITEVGIEVHGIRRWNKFGAHELIVGLTVTVEGIGVGIRWENGNINFDWNNAYATRYAANAAADRLRDAALLKTKPSPKTGERTWHTAPDGSECCCTAGERRYGCGCR